MAQIQTRSKIVQMSVVPCTVNAAYLENKNKNR